MTDKVNEEEDDDDNDKKSKSHERDFAQAEKSRYSLKGIAVYLDTGVRVMVFKLLLNKPGSCVVYIHVKYHLRHPYLEDLLIHFALN